MLFKAFTSALLATAAVAAPLADIASRAVCTVSGVELTVGKIVSISGNQAGTVVAINNDAITLDLCSGGSIGVSCGDILSLSAGCPSTKRDAVCTVSGVELSVGKIVSVSGGQSGTVVDISNDAISLNLCSGGSISVTCGDILSLSASCPATKRDAICTVSGVELSVGKIVSVSGGQSGTVIDISNDAITLDLCSGGSISVSCGDILSLSVACPSTSIKRAVCTVSGVDLSVGKIVEISGNEAGTVVAINNDAVTLDLCSGGSVGVSCGDILSFTASCPATKRDAVCTVSGIELTVGKIVTISGNQSGTVIDITNGAITLNLCSGGSVTVSCGDILSLSAKC